MKSFLQATHLKKLFLTDKYTVRKLENYLNEGHYGEKASTYGCLEPPTLNPQRFTATTLSKYIPGLDALEISVLMSCHRFLDSGRP